MCKFIGQKLVFYCIEQVFIGKIKSVLVRLRYMIVFGIDPGSVYTGFGVIKTSHKGDMQHLDSGRICCGRRCFSDRLTLIYTQLTGLLLEYKPDFVVVEQLFVHKNAMSALKLGHARGVAVLAGNQSGANLVEYTPRHVKKALTGYGGANKDQVGYMVKMMLSLPVVPVSDAADALALAMTHAQIIRTQRLTNKEVSL